MSRAARNEQSISRRHFLGLGVGAAAGAMIAGCGGGKSASEAAGGGGAQPAQTFSGTYDGPEVTLSYWNGFTGGDGPFMKQLVKDFTAEHQNIKIAENTVQWNEYYQRMPAAVTAGKGPDVGAMHLDQLATNAARKVIVPVDDLAASLGLTEDDFTTEVWNAGIYQDARYGIPLDVHSLAMYSLNDPLQKAGVTEMPTDNDSFMATLDQLKSSGTANPFWMPTRWPAHLMFLSLLWQNGGEPYAEDGTKATFDSEEGVAALQWMVDVINKGYSPKNVAQDSQYVAFKNGEVPITWDGIWQINDLKTAGVENTLSPIPKIGETDHVWANSHNFYITRQTTGDDNKLQAAKVFIDWISRKSAEWAGAGMIPARKSVRDSAQVQDSPQGPIAAKIDTLKFLPPVPGLGDVQAQTLEIAVANATLGKESPADALSSQAARASKLMEENKKKFG
ncbi:ABC transporter substrate-binding protein [Motilibacter aurantiacus]|uniref:ABC transporter substrate-binding protein n=1 Tax=Motilibacter aurantiacus TaxID=2714955 RepID=UPI001408626C|nr:ABC transporter substrate-binding protein [Motilibacter aurantiacus]NHC45484.1 ABC transporter substrate-binding protein [Motilibacter aurantiacus]